MSWTIRTLERERFLRNGTTCMERHTASSAAKALIGPSLATLRVLCDALMLERLTR